MASAPGSPTSPPRFLQVQVAAGAAAVQLFDSWAGSLSAADYAPLRAAVLGPGAGGRSSSGVPRIHFGVGTGELLGADGRGRRRTSSASTGGCRWPRRAAASGPTTPCRATSTRRCSAAPWAVLAERVREVVRSGAPAPGHVFNLGHGVPPDADPEVLRAIVDLVHEEGRAASAGAQPRGSTSRGRDPESPDEAALPVVVGGGISGLAAARLLVEAGCRSACWKPVRGGAASSRRCGSTASGWTAVRSPAGPSPGGGRLPMELGLADRLVYPTDAKPGLLLGGAVTRCRPRSGACRTDLAAAARPAQPGRVRRGCGRAGSGGPPWSATAAIGGYVDERFGTRSPTGCWNPCWVACTRDGPGSCPSRRSHRSSSPELAPGGRCWSTPGAGAASGAGPVFAGLVGGCRHAGGRPGRGPATARRDSSRWGAPCAS